MPEEVIEHSRAVTPTPPQLPSQEVLFSSPTRSSAFRPLAKPFLSLDQIYYRSAIKIGQYKKLNHQICKDPSQIPDFLNFIVEHLKSFVDVKQKKAFVGQLFFAFESIASFFPSIDEFIMKADQINQFRGISIFIWHVVLSKNFTALNQWLFECKSLTSSLLNAIKEALVHCIKQEKISLAEALVLLDNHSMRERLLENNQFTCNDIIAAGNGLHRQAQAAEFFVLEAIKKQKYHSLKKAIARGLLDENNVIVAFKKAVADKKITIQALTNIFSEEYIDFLKKEDSVFYVHYLLECLGISADREVLVLGAPKKAEGRIAKVNDALANHSEDFQLEYRARLIFQIASDFGKSAYCDQYYQGLIPERLDAKRALQKHLLGIAFRVPRVFLVLVECGALDAADVIDVYLSEINQGAQEYNVYVIQRLLSSLKMDDRQPINDLSVPRGDIPPLVEELLESPSSSQASSRPSSRTTEDDGSIILHLLSPGESSQTPTKLPDRPDVSSDSSSSSASDHFSDWSQTPNQTCPSSVIVKTPPREAMRSQKPKTARRSLSAELEISHDSPTSKRRFFFDDRGMVEVKKTSEIWLGLNSPDGKVKPTSALHACALAIAFDHCTNQGLSAQERFEVNLVRFLKSLAILGTLTHEQSVRQLTHKKDPIREQEKALKDFIRERLKAAGLDNLAVSTFDDESPLWESLFSLKNYSYEMLSETTNQLLKNQTFVTFELPNQDFMDSRRVTAADDDHYEGRAKSIDQLVSVKKNMQEDGQARRDVRDERDNPEVESAFLVECPEHQYQSMQVTTANNTYGFFFHPKKSKGLEEYRRRQEEGASLKIDTAPAPEQVTPGLRVGVS